MYLVIHRNLFWVAIGALVALLMVSLLSQRTSAPASDASDVAPLAQSETLPLAVTVTCPRGMQTAHVRNIHHPRRDRCDDARRTEVEMDLINFRARHACARLNPQSGLPKRVESMHMVACRHDGPLRPVYGPTAGLKTGTWSDVVVCCPPAPPYPIPEPLCGLDATVMEQRYGKWWSL